MRALHVAEEFYFLVMCMFLRRKNTTMDRARAVACRAGRGVGEVWRRAILLGKSHARKHHTDACVTAAHPDWSRVFLGIFTKNKRHRRDIVAVADRGDLLGDVVRIEISIV